MGKNTLTKKLRGYQKSPRDRFFLLKDGVLTQEEFILYELGIAITDWDRSHIETYGTFFATNLELAESLGWKSDSTASRYKINLLEKGFFVPVGEERLRAKDFSLWELKKSSLKTQEISANNGDQVSNLHEPSAKMQENQSSDVNSSLVSFKGGVRVNEKRSGVNEDLSDEEIDQIIREIDLVQELSIHSTNKPIDELKTDEQLSAAQAVFGEGTKWSDE
jgi:hypothetical protein